MNFLAHFHLSNSSEPLIVGNFLGDFLSNREVALLPADIQRGVQLHRAIDTYTDQHPVVRESTALLRPAHGKYAPVVADVLYDFLLVKNWKAYSDVPLALFTQNIYGILQRHTHLMPGYLRTRLPLMVADDWLVRYGTEAGLDFTFGKMKMRSTRPALFENAVQSLRTHLVPLDDDFNRFFPEAVAYFKNSFI